MIKHSVARNLLVPVLALFALSGCATGTTHHSSSVVNYLYPDRDRPIETAQVPALSLPLKVGVAFVPESTGRNPGFSADEKQRLLGEISSHFKQQDFVDTIEILPSAYLRTAGSFTNLDQIQTMYGIDVIALVSYDQTQFTDEGLASFTYWTLIGAYIVPGEKNDTHTMLDTAVYDIKSRSLLFRAPGSSHIKGRSTLVNLSEQLRTDSIAGFTLAGEDLVGNLEEQLLMFKDKVKNAPDDVQVTHKSGYVGAGSLDLVFLLPNLLFALCWLGRARRRQK